MEIERRRYSTLINTHNKNINTISNVNFHNKIFGFDINLLNEYFTKNIISYCKFDFNQSKKLKNLPFRNELIENTSHTKIINDCLSPEDKTLRQFPGIYQMLLSR